LAGNLIIVGSSDGRLYALQQQDGAVVWNFLTSERIPVWTSPAVVDGRTYFGAHDGNVNALEGTQ
jgi:outer membrane protein assembly factor BamB